MGQKVHPVGFRIGITRDWDSKWYAEADYQRFLHEDIRIRRFLKDKLKDAGVSSVTIERAANKAKVYVHAAKPGLIIGKRAAGLDSLRAEMQKMSDTEIFLNIIEVRKVETDALLIAENIAAQLVKRVSFRRAMKKAVTSSRRAGARASKSCVPVVWAEPRCPVASGTERDAFLSILFVPTWTTGLPRPRPHTASLASRCGFSRVKCCLAKKAVAHSRFADKPEYLQE